VAETDEQKIARWSREDENERHGAASGNPCAYLCDHCYGKHKAPRNKECPNESIDELKARLKTQH
jgi:hypothetical protein